MSKDKRLQVYENVHPEALAEEKADERELTEAKNQRKTALRPWLWLFLGALCFFVSQPLLRLPLLNVIMGQTRVVLWTRTHFVLLLALSAGLFEESARFIFKRFWLKPPRCTFGQPLIFGLGHGLCEALLLLVPLFLRGGAGHLLPLVERVLAILFHISASVVVWNGFQLGQPWRYGLLAVFLHSLADSGVLFVAQWSRSIGWTFASLALFDALLLAYVFYSKRYYGKRVLSENQGDTNEK